MLSLRPITIQDAALLLAWRNDPDTRLQSRNTDEVLLENHVAWLTKSFTMPSRKLYIAEHNGSPVGTVRSDKNKDGAVEVSFTIAPEARGKGFGKAMVTQFATEIIPREKLIMGIRRGNIASEKIAQALGLHQVGPELPEEASDERAVMVWC